MAALSDAATFIPTRSYKKLVASNKMSGTNM